MSTFDRAWADAVCRACDPVTDAADVGFRRQLSVERGRTRSILWEADPLRFAARYPDSGIEESYGDQWPAPCIDWWVYVHDREPRAELSIEGWDHEVLDVGLSGDGVADGALLADLLAGLLRVPHPSG